MSHIVENAIEKKRSYSFQISQVAQPISTLSSSLAETKLTRRLSLKDVFFILFVKLSDISRLVSNTVFLCVPHEKSNSTTRVSVAACGVAVSVLMHKGLPGILDVKSDATETYTVNKGVVMAPHLTDTDSSLWSKVRFATILGYETYQLLFFSLPRDQRMQRLSGPRSLTLSPLIVTGVKFSLFSFNPSISTNILNGLQIVISPV